jgi:predicted DNA-binding mobile mystery protein A
MSSKETLAGLHRRLQRKEIDQFFEANPRLRLDLSPPTGGWLKAIRTSLGMTTEQLGRRVRVTQSTASRAERAETEGRISLNTLERMADALGCDVGYTLIPRTALDMVVHNRANQAAHRIVGEVTQGMALEGQSTDDHSRSGQVDAVRERLIAQGSSEIWD